MAAPVPASVDVTAQPRWGMGDAVAGWLIAYSSAILIGGVIVASLGYSGADQADIPLYVLALGYPPLWVGFVGVPWVVASTKGRGIVRDFRLRVEALDAPIGLVLGVIAQIVVVPLVALPVLWLSGTSVDDLGKPARELADKAGSTPGVVLFFLLVGVGAPIAEEIFFRGLVLRSIEKRFGRTWALWGSSVAFGATHFQALQLVPLVVAGLLFGWLALHFDRLGPAIFAHMGFNITTVVVLVWFT